jgi:hypothetical protein
MEHVAEAEGVQDQERGAGIGDLRLRSFPEAREVAAPAPGVVNLLDEIVDRTPHSRIVRQPEPTQHTRGFRRVARIHGRLRAEPDPPVVSASVEEELEATGDSFVVGADPELVQHPQAPDRAEGIAHVDLTLRGGPIVGAIVVTSGEDRLDVRCEIRHSISGSATVARSSRQLTLRTMRRSAASRRSRWYVRKFSRVSGT